MSLLSLFMKKEKTRKLNSMEMKNLVDVFDWLLKQDKKQNPDNYKKLPEGVVLDKDGNQVIL
jgi:hypothetical protein